MLRVLLPIFPWQSVDNVSQPRCSRMRPDDVDFVGAVETKAAEGSLRTYVLWRFSRRTFWLHAALHAGSKLY